MSECRSCGAEVEWAFTVNDKRVPLDIGTVANGNLRVTHQRASEFGMTPVVEYVRGAEVGDRVSHFATCPNASQHRKASSG